jgi:malonyl-CoA O-methyltransferase
VFAAENGFPVEIDAADGRLAAVLQWCRDLGPARIIDVGCGKGRFLRHLRRAAPQATLVGVDLSPAALAALPDGVERRQGDLLRLPAGTGEFDAALCVEALEHSLLPRRAVAELCRVVRPGGSILIIDKNASHQPLSDHQPWERWFRPGEIAGWLAAEADDICVRPVAHGGRPAPSGLFLCWTGRRREGQCGRRAA